MERGYPTYFPEQRSLAERLYREQGVDTKTLLGHKNQAMTDKYNDDRGKEWLVLAV
ncbi:integrase [Yersinia nurmii]|uniref:Integrase n=1 Tax=Yersinia nurmii TaxID=685706 RepID=A0ABM9S0L1_9GAMM|nr:integrase [Yersinia nurmii]